MLEMKKIKAFVLLTLMFSAIVAVGQKDNTLAKKGIKFGKKGDFKRALEYFEKSLEINPSNLNALYYKAYSLEQLNEFDKAIEAYSITMKYKQDGAIYFRRGWCYFRLKDYDSAIRDYNKASEYLPDNDEINMGKASVYLHTEKYQKLLDALNLHLEKVPDDLYSKANKANALSKLNRHSEALELFFELLIKMPEKHRHKICNGIANTYMLIEKYDKAFEYVDKAFDYNSKYGEAHITKAEIFMALNKKDKAFEEIQKAKTLGVDMNHKDIKQLVEKCKL